MMLEQLTENEHQKTSSKKYGNDIIIISKLVDPNQTNQLVFMDASRKIIGKSRYADDIWTAFKFIEQNPPAAKPRFELNESSDSINIKVNL